MNQVRTDPQSYLDLLAEEVKEHPINNCWRRETCPYVNDPDDTICCPDDGTWVSRPTNHNCNDCDLETTNTWERGPDTDPENWW